MVHLEAVRPVRSQITEERSSRVLEVDMEVEELLKNSLRSDCFDKRF